MTFAQLSKTAFTLGVPALLLSAALTVGCGDSKRPVEIVHVDGPGDDVDAATKGDAAVDVQESAFIVATRVWDDASTSSYFHVLDSLDEGTTVDASKALEVAGSARLFALEEVGWFGIGGAEEPTITAYQLSGDNKLVEGETISLQQYGTASLWPTMYYVSPQKVYHPDRENQQLIIWNPTKMQIEGSIALPETNRDGYLAVYGYASIKRGRKLLFSVGWFDWQASDKVVAETGLVVIDTETDTVERIDVDDRCAGITETVELPSGDAYFVSSALGAAAYELDRLEVEPCALRVNADESHFDSEYALKLGQLTDGALAGDPIPGPGNQMFLRVFDKSLSEVQEGALTYEVTSQPAWSWMLWDPSTNEVDPVEGLPIAPANVSWFKADGKVFTIQEKAEPFESTLVELTAENGPKVRLTAPGYLHALARVR